VATLRGLDTTWTVVVPRSPLQGDSRNRFVVPGAGPYTHLCLNIYPDGGVARLRVHGRVTPDWDTLDFHGGLIDLAAAENGGVVTAVSDDFFGHRMNLIMPGTPRNMADGWETRRRRGPGHDWAILRLGTRGAVERVEVDTSHFKGNAPGTCWLEIADLPEGTDAAAVADDRWRPLLTRMRLQPHARHPFGDLEPAGPATHVRLHIDPDGGVARLRLWGRSERSRTMILGLGRLNALDRPAAVDALLAVCGSKRWAEETAALRPFVDVSSLMRAADLVWRGCDPAEQLDAFAAHARLGERAASAWSREEQAGVELADADVLAALADANAAYEARFGRVFLICATGLHADQMLAALRDRLANDSETEHAIAAEEQRKITRIRLEKWLRGA
jgi:allantoicase